MKNRIVATMRFFLFEETNMAQLNEILSKWQNDAVFQSLKSAKATFWQNTHHTHFAQAQHDCDLSLADVQDAAARLQRFAPYFEAVFPETRATHGIIESPVYHLQNFANEMNLKGNLYLKADNQLPISGSIKARGGIYEVLKFAEDLALQHNLLNVNDNYAKFAEPAMRDFFADYTVAVGSTGNLGLSIGIMAAKLGFQAAVHMSADAKQWKKDLLRTNGVQVFEYDGDYSIAVAEGRAQIQQNPKGYFVDDEQSRHLFLGYAVAGLRLKNQFENMGIKINAQRPLYVYLPCGVGGAPCGVAFGLKWAFGDHVHCVLAEPTHSPCVFLGVLTDLHDEIAVQDIGLDNKTLADGLAVGRASAFASRAMYRSLSAFYTVEDATLFDLLKRIYHSENLRLEPSACAGLVGVRHFEHVPNAVHLAWATGGNLVPDDVFAAYLAA